MRRLIFILILIVNNLSYAQNRKEKIISVIDEELSEVKRLAEKQDYRNPDTLLRISELVLEKAKIIRDEENNKFLNIDPDKRRSIDKKTLFSGSEKLFKLANQSAERVVKDFPRYSQLGEVFFILGSNNKEIGNHKEAKKYFIRSYEFPGVSKKIKSQSMLAVADYEYNDKNFKDSVSLYEKSLKDKQNKWWTKDAFNLAWSYYRIRKYDKAIDLMLEIHRLSKNKNFVDLSTQVERDIGIFYVDSKQINEAIKFYSQNNIDFSMQFMKVAENLISQGRFAQAESLLNEIKDREKNTDKRVRILLSQIQLYDKYDKIDQHFNSCSQLVMINDKSPLEKDSLSRAIYQVDKKASELQRQVVSEIYKNVPKVRKSKTDYAVKYFDLSRRLQPDKKSEKFFFQAETYFSSDDFLNALPAYMSSFDSAKDNQLKQRSLEGMLSSLASFKNERLSEKFYIPVYTRYLSFDKKSDRSANIYIKLFNSYFSSGDVKSAESLMFEYAKMHPQDSTKLEGMLAKIMEYYRQKKDYKTLLLYVKKIENNEFKVSSKYQQALKSLVTKIQIEEVQKDLDSGNKTQALKGYHKIFSNPESTPKAKANSAYNLAVLYHELGDSTKTLDWSNKALDLMDINDVVNFGTSFIGISSVLFLKQKFNESSAISMKYVEKTCRNFNKNKDISLRNAFYIKLSGDDIDGALTLLNIGKRCEVSPVTLRDLSFEVLKELSRISRWETYENLIDQLDNDPKNHPSLILPLEALRKEYSRIGESQKSQEIDKKQSDYFLKAKKQNLELPVEALDLVAEKIIQNIKSKIDMLNGITLKFPEDSFNNSVKNKLQLLEKVTADVDKIKMLGSGKGLVQGYYYLITSYESFTTELSNFIPPDRPETYVASFKTAMADVINPMKLNTNKLKKDIQDIILKNNILSDYNSALLSRDPTSLSGQFFSVDGITMERKGVR